MRSGYIMFLQFENGQELRSIPDGNSMELYVITTPLGFSRYVK